MIDVLRSTTSRGRLLVAGKAELDVIVKADEAHQGDLIGNASRMEGVQLIAQSDRGRRDGVFGHQVESLKDAIMQAGRHFIEARRIRLAFPRDRLSAVAVANVQRAPRSTA